MSAASSSTAQNRFEAMIAAHDGAVLVFEAQKLAEFAENAAIFPADRPKVARALKNAGEGVFETDLRWKNAAGAFRHSLARGVPVGENGVLTEWLVVVSDRHEEVEAQNQLALQEARLKTLTRATSMALWTWEPQTQRTTLNQNLGELLGFSRPLASPAELESLVHPADLSIVKRHFEGVLSNGEKNEFEFRVCAPRFNADDCAEAPDADNPSHWHWMICVLFAQQERDANGEEKIVVFGLNRDISARKNAEAARINADLRYRALIDLSPQVVFTAQPDGMLTYINSAAAQFMGMSDAAALGESWIAAIHPDDRERVLARWLDSVQSGAPYEIEMRFFRASDASHRWHVTRARPLRDANGNIEAWLGVAIDVDEIKQAQYQAESQRLEVEQASRARDEFLAVVSHELRTPLSAILGWVSLMRAGNLDEAGAAQALEIIERNALAQAQIVEDVLDVARVVTGNLRIDRYLLDFGGVVSEALQIVENAAKAKNIRLETHLEPLRWVEGDVGRLRQVVGNLLSNAVKFTPEGGTIQVVLNCEGERAKLMITDNGQGIAPDFLPHVWERFRQADGSTSRRHGGLGLGLALVRQLVEAHDGSVGAHSDGENCGATFCVFLPLSQQKIASEAPRPIESSKSLTGRSILWVEDSPDTRDLIGLMLEMEGAQVRATNDVASARRLLEHERFDLILTDLGLPDENGFALLRWVQKRHLALPIVVVSAYADQRAKALEAGCALFVAKPVIVSDLLDAVQRALNTTRSTGQTKPDFCP